MTQTRVLGPDFRPVVGLRILVISNISFVFFPDDNVFRLLQKGQFFSAPGHNMRIQGNCIGEEWQPAGTAAQNSITIIFATGKVTLSCDENLGKYFASGKIGLTDLANVSLCFKNVSCFIRKVVIGRLPLGELRPLSSIRLSLGNVRFLNPGIKPLRKYQNFNTVWCLLAVRSREFPLKLWICHLGSKQIK